MSVQSKKHTDVKGMKYYLQAERELEEEFPSETDLLDEDTELEDDEH